MTRPDGSQGGPSPGPTSFVLIASPDVHDSVGRAGFLEARLRASRADAPAPHVRLVPGIRCDVFAQQLSAGGEVPDIPAPEGLEEWFASMFAPVELNDDTALLALSMSDALGADVRRHATRGSLVQPPTDHRRTWTEEQRDWLDTQFAPHAGDTADMEDALRTIAARLAPLPTELLVFNVSTYTPDEKAYWFRDDTPEPIALRANRINLLIDRLAAELDLYVLDVDRIVAELGAADTVVAPAGYTEAALRVIADEAGAAIANLPGVSLAFGADAMQLAVPRFDRRTEAGQLVAWHVGAPAEIRQGDPLFDVRFDNLHTRLDGQGGRKTDRSLLLSVLATQDGYLRETTLPAGADITVGSMVGVVVKDASIVPGDLADAAKFPVGVKVAGRRSEEED